MASTYRDNLMSLCIRAVLPLLALLFQFFVADHTAIAGEGNAKDDKSSIETGVNNATPSRAQLASAIREAIFRNRQQLLEYLGARATTSLICTPGQNDSYDLFQASLREELDVLWDLDIYAIKYGLSKKQHNSVKACSTRLEEYLDNFELWQQLSRHAESP